MYISILKYTPHSSYCLSKFLNVQLRPPNHISAHHDSPLHVLYLSPITCTICDNNLRSRHSACIKMHVEIYIVCLLDGVSLTIIVHRNISGNLPNANLIIPLFSVLLHLHLRTCLWCTFVMYRTNEVFLTELRVCPEEITCSQNL